MRGLTGALLNSPLRFQTKSDDFSHPIRSPFRLFAYWWIAGMKQAKVLPDVNVNVKRARLAST
jgi:hypothetical protein